MSESLYGVVMLNEVKHLIAIQCIYDEGVKLRSTRQGVL
jgi:hypothetical protein